MSDELFDTAPYTSRRTSTRTRPPAAAVVPELWRPGWFRMRKAKGTTPEWHRLASPMPDRHGSYTTRCGIVGGRISHDPEFDGRQMVACAECAVGEPRTTRPARRTDPQTSHDAARSVTDATTRTQLTRIERAIHEAGERGLTDEELCRELADTGWAASGIRTRRRTLADMAVIGDRGTRPSQRGRQMRVWVHAEHLPTPEGTG